MKAFIFSVILSAMILFVPTMNTHAEDDSFTYTIINNEVTIVGFTGEPEYIEIPDTLEGLPVTEIRDNAFYKCGSLKEIVIPQTVEKIGHHCFYACDSLAEITVPQSVREIGMGSFCGCTSLKSVSLPDSLTVLPDSCFRACTSLTEIIIPQTVRHIDKFCFSGCTSLEFVSLGSELTELGARAFFMCDNLESLYIPPSVTHIGTEAAGYTSSGNLSAIKSDFLILGRKNSEAELYAEENSFAFSEADETSQAFASGLSAFTSPKSAARFIITGLLIFGTALALTVRQIIHEK